MRVLRVGFVGTRTAEITSMTGFFRDVLGLEVVRDTPDWSILRLPTGEHDYAEVYGSDFDDPRFCPPDVGLMVAFVVDDVEGAHTEVLEAGMRASEVMWAAEGFGWFFVRAPDGNTYVIQQTPATGDSPG